MRAYIVHEQRKPRLFGRPRVEVLTRVDFTEAERLTIAQWRLDDYVVLERFPDVRTAGNLDPGEQERWLGGFHLRVGDLLGAEPDRFALDDPYAAKVYETRLTEALRQLQTFLVENARGAKPRKLEF